LFSSFSNTKATEYQVEDVVGGGRTGDFIERAEGSIEIQQKHLMGDFVGDGGAGVFESG
jgi:hypothetical protein